MGAVGRITPAGKVKKFSLPVHPAPPGVGGGITIGEITAGPDGAMWFTYRTRVGRITTSGKINDFEPPSDLPPDQNFFAGELRGIASGPDGAVWVTQPARGRILRVTTAATLRVSLKVKPDAGCASSSVAVEVKAKGNQLRTLKLSLDGKQLARTDRRTVRVNVDVRQLQPGTHTLQAVAVNAAGARATQSRTLVRCGGAAHTRPASP